MDKKELVHVNSYKKDDFFAGRSGGESVSRAFRVVLGNSKKQSREQGRLNDAVFGVDVSI